MVKASKTPFGGNDWNSTFRESVEAETNLENNTNSLSDLNLFLTFVLKSLENQERKILLKILLNTNWDDSDKSLEHQLQELLTRKKNDDYFQNSFNYDHFLWDFTNWKNFLLSKDK